MYSRIYQHLRQCQYIFASRLTTVGALTVKLAVYSVRQVYLLPNPAYQNQSCLPFFRVSRSSVRSSFNPISTSLHNCSFRTHGES